MQTIEYFKNLNVLWLYKDIKRYAEEQNMDVKIIAITREGISYTDDVEAIVVFEKHGG